MGMIFAVEKEEENAWYELTENETDSKKRNVNWIDSFDKDSINNYDNCLNWDY